MGFKHCWIKRVTGRVQINEISACLLTADTIHPKKLECIPRFDNYFFQKPPDSVNAS